MSSRFILPFADVGSGIKPSSGAKLFFYEVDGVTLKDTYSDQLSTPTPNTNPVISDSNGLFGDIYIDGTYKVTLKNKNDSLIFSLARVDSDSGAAAISSTTTDLIASTADYAIDVVIKTSGFTTSGDGGDAAWLQNGITGQAASQTPAQLGDSLLNDGNGDQWVFVGGVVKPAQLGDSMLAALNSDLVVDITGAGSVAISSQLTITKDINIFCRDDSVITGYDGLGVLFSGSKITLDGVNISGFYDGTDQNVSNFGTAFIRIATGTTVDAIRVIGGSSTNCRSVIRGTGITSDTAVDTTILVKDILITGNNVIDGCPLAYYFRCAYTNAKIIGNTCLNAIGGSKGLTPYSFYVDGVGFDAAIYAQIGGVVFSNNYANTIVNRTTTGDSTSGNSFECHVFKASGEKITIENNIIIDCTGVNYDCEALYTKARYVTVNNNLMIDAGTNEGAINIKGTSESSDGSNTSPFGEYSKVSDNIVVFTRSVYDNDGTIVNLDTVGIHAAVPDKSIVSGNMIIGANENDIVIDGTTGPATDNSCVVVAGNISNGMSGESSIKFRGAFKRVKVHDNICDNVTTDASSFYMIDLLSVANRGNLNDLNEFYDNQLKLGYETANESGFTHSFIRIDLENYDFNILRVSNNLIDINNTSASARPIYVYAQTSGYTGSLSKLIVHGNTFANNSYSKGPVFFSKTPLSFDLDLVYDFISTQNATVDAIQIDTSDSTELDAELRVFSTRVDTSGEAQRDISNFIGFTAASVLNTIDNTAATAVGNATGISATLATSTNILRVRISGEDAQTWSHKIKLKVSNK